jgi:hypothetical protein
MKVHTANEPLAIEPQLNDVLDPALVDVTDRTIEAAKTPIKDVGNYVKALIKPQENITTDKMQLANDENKKLLALSDMLLDLRADLVALDENAKELPETTLQKLADLKKNGIDLWKGDKKITPKVVEDLKNLAGAKADSLKTQSSTIFTFKVQKVFADIQAILSAIQTMLNGVEKLGNKACQIKH